MFHKAAASSDIVDHEDKIAQVRGSRGSVQDAVPSTMHTRKLGFGPCGAGFDSPWSSSKYRTPFVSTSTSHLPLLAQASVVARLSKNVLHILRPHIRLTYTVQATLSLPRPL